MKSLKRLAISIAIFSLVMNVYASDPHSQPDSDCLACHNGMFDGKPGHFIQDNVDCMFCHSWTTSGGSVFYVSNTNLVCVACHADHSVENQTVSHSNMQCIDCHNPHGSANEHMFTKTEITLCGSNCHGQHDLGLSHPTGEGTVDKITGGEVTCISTCHTMHQPVEEKMLQVASIDLCYQCHDK